MAKSKRSSINDDFLARAGCARPINDEQYEKWLETVRVRLGSLDKLQISIFNVPSGQRKKTRDQYAPRTVCIGPLHLRKKHYLIDDVDKFRYMLHFLSRFAGGPRKALEKCAGSIRKLEPKARKTYWKTIRLKSYETMEMLLVDGCFLLELFIRFLTPERHKDDPLLGGAWMLEDLRHDLVLLENQIPFDILQRLFQNLQQSVNDQNFPPNLTSCILHFFQPALSLKEIKTEKPIMHILDMIHNVFLSNPPEEQGTDIATQIDMTPNNGTNTTTQIDMTPNNGTDTATQSDKTPNNESSSRKLGFRQSAKNLENEGIRFEKGDKNLLLNISFDKEKGVLTIPYLSINRSTKSIFKNLIAFEQCCPGSKHQILSSYVILMRSLLDSKHDVELLRQKRIIEKNPTSGENIIKFFKDLCPEVLEMKRFDSTDHKENQEFQLWLVIQEVNKYIENRCWWQKVLALLKKFLHRSWVVMTEKYFATTWSISSVIVAIVLLVLTALQTVYTVISYYHQG